MRVVSLTWAELKTVQATKSLPWQYANKHNRYVVFLADGDTHYECSLFKSGAGVSGGVTPAMDTDRADFEASVMPLCNKVATGGPRVDGRPQASMFPPEGSSVNLISHNWCDPTTWYTKATAVTGEVASDSGDRTTYNLANANVIDTFHGKLTGEDFILDAAGGSYRVAAYINGIQKTEVDPHTGVGDYTVNYSTGSVTFGTSNSAGDVVTVDYQHATTSEFIVRPTAGKRLRLKRVEVQFTDNIDISDSMTFVPYGLVDVFAPQLVNNPYSPGTKIPLQSGTKYKTMMDYINESNGAQPKIIDLGGVTSNWRASQSKVVILVWDYMTMDTISSAAGMEIQIKLEHDTPFGSTDGGYSSGVSTFYCLSEAEG